MSPAPDESYSGGKRLPSTDGNVPSSDESAFRIPRGDLLGSRVVSDLTTPLSMALDRELSGYATIVPQETLLLSGEVRGVITFEDGVPMLAYNSVTDNGGADALAEVAVPGPYRVELYRVDEDALDIAHDAEALRVAPGSVATELADDTGLAERTRAVAPDHRTTDHGTEDVDAVTAFLEDDDRIEAIRKQARSEARSRAEAWGFVDALSSNQLDDHSAEAPVDAPIGCPTEAPADAPTDRQAEDPTDVPIEDSTGSRIE